MPRTKDSKFLKIESPNTPLSFATSGGGDWKVWDRFIAVEGENIFHIGNICGTCDFFFEKLKSRTELINPDSAIEALNNGFDEIDESTLSTFNELIPSGQYHRLRLSVNPSYVELGGTNDYFVNEQVALFGIDGYRGKPHSPEINYYRGTDYDIGDDCKIFEFFIPLTSEQSLNSDRVEFYKNEIQTGKRPTVLSLSLLDVKEPAVWPDDDIKPEFTSHWCFAHYILDGHHKIRAAAELSANINLLCYLSTEQGISSDEELNKLLKTIK